MVSVTTRIRKSLGAMRQELFYGRDNRRIAQAARAAQAGWSEVARLQLPPLPPRPEAPVFEVHCVSGEKQMPMTGWCCWSLMRFLPEAQLVLHDDGSLSPESRTEMRRAVPGLRLVDPQQRLSAARERFGDLPRLMHWLETYHFGFKFMMQATAGTSRIIDLDSDVLTFREPAVLRQWAGDPSVSMAWNLDMHYSYAYPEALLKEILGDLVGPLPYRLNGGLGLFGVFTPEEWQRLEVILERFEADSRTDPLRYWMHQTLQACVASRRAPAGRPLPAEHDIYLGPTRPQSVMRHFVGHPRARPRFFTEGVPRVVAEARASGLLPGDFAADHVPA